MDATKKRSPDEPPAAERADISRRIRLLPLCRRDQPGVIDWPRIAGRLAEELATISQRLADDPHASAGDHERVGRATTAIRDYQTARAADHD
jgi:hypothetical protein